MLGTVLFLWPWWNRYVGLTLDGYFPLYGHLLLAGQVPYRDFFLHVPPLQALIEAALETLVGRSLFAVRLAGALGRVALAGVLAGWLSRRYRPGVATFAALAAVWLASGDDTEILDLYNHHALLAALVAGWAASAALDVSRGRRSERLLWLLSGFAAGISIWTKQTIGLGATLAIPAVLALLALGDRGLRARLASRLLLFAAGWALPAAVLGGWLASAGALEAFVQQVFLAAAASKGDPMHLLLRPWVGPFQIPILAGPALAGIALAAVALLVTGLGQRPPVEAGARVGRARAATRLLTLTLVAVGAVLLIGWTLAEYSRDVELDLRTLQRVGVYLGWFGLLVPGLALTVRASRRELDGAARERLLQIALAGAVAATLALSWPGGEAMALPSLAVVLASIAQADPARGGVRFLRAGLIALAVAIGVATFALRLLEPFEFALWREPPVALATHRLRDPTLAGLWVAPGTAEALEGTLAIVRRTTSAGEPIFTFPALPIFHWLADRPLSTFAALHWIDVTPDAIAREDILRLRASPPAVVLRQHIPARLLKLNEGYFRGGVGESGLRDLDVALVELLTEHYRLEAEFGQYQGHAPHLEVWVRNDR